VSAPRRIRIALLIFAVALALVPLSGERFWVQFAAKTMIGALFAMSLDLLVGYAGIVSLAHAAFFGLGAYLLAGLTNGAGLTSPLATFPLALAGTALAALVIGFLSLRTSGVYLVMITLAFTQMLYYLFGEAPGRSGVIEMDVTKKNVANIARFGTKFAKLRSNVLEGRLRSGIEEHWTIVRLEQGRRDDPGTAEVLSIENVDHVL